MNFDAYLIVLFSDENGRKTPISTFVSIFLAGTGSGSENAVSKTEPKFADFRKRTNTGGNGNGRKTVTTAGIPRTKAYINHVPRLVALEFINN